MLNWFKSLWYDFWHPKSYLVIWKGCKCGGDISWTETHTGDIINLFNGKGWVSHSDNPCRVDVRWECSKCHKRWKKRPKESDK